MRSFFALLTLAIASLAFTGQASAAIPRGEFYVFNVDAYDAKGLNQRSAPRTSAPRVGKRLHDGDRVSPQCWIKGGRVYVPALESYTRRWLRLGPKRYVSAGFIAYDDDRGEPEPGYLHVRKCKPKPEPTRQGYPD